MENVLVRSYQRNLDLPSKGERKMATNFRINIEGRIDPEKVRELAHKHHQDVFERGGCTNPNLPRDDDEYLLGYLVRSFASSISHAYDLDSVIAELSDVEEVKWVEATHLSCASLPFVQAGWKVIELSDIRHPSLLAIEMNGNRAIAFHEDIDLMAFMHKDIECEAEGDYTDIEDAIKKQLEPGNEGVELMVREEFDPNYITFSPGPEWLCEKFEVRVLVNEARIGVYWK